MLHIKLLIFHQKTGNVALNKLQEALSYRNRRNVPTFRLKITFADRLDGQKIGDRPALREREGNGQQKIGDSPALREREGIAKQKLGHSPALKESEETGQANWR